MVFEMEEINDDWDEVDVTLVIGGTTCQFDALLRLAEGFL